MIKQQKAAIFTTRHLQNKLSLEYLLIILIYLEARYGQVNSFCGNPESLLARISYDQDRKHALPLHHAIKPDECNTENICKTFIEHEIVVTSLNGVEISEH